MKSRVKRIGLPFCPLPAACLGNELLFCTKRALASSNLKEIKTFCIASAMQFKRHTMRPNYLEHFLFLWGCRDFMPKKQQLKIPPINILRRYVRNASYDKALLAKILVRKLEHELKFILEERRFRHWAGYFCRLACLVTRYGKWWTAKEIRSDLLLYYILLSVKGRKTQEQTGGSMQEKTTLLAF